MKTPARPFSCAAAPAGDSNTAASTRTQEACALISIPPSVSSSGLLRQVLVEPSDDVLETFDPMPWLARPREFVALTRETNHGRLTLQILQCTKQIFASSGRRRAEVLVAKNEQQRRLDLLNVGDG